MEEYFQPNIKTQQYRLKINTSEYSQLYRQYIHRQYPSVQRLVHKLVQMPFCEEVYLKFPLQGLLKGICKKMLINEYQLVVFGVVLSHIDWTLDVNILHVLKDDYPHIIHVNDPSSISKFKEISILLYLSCYSVKLFLNENVQLIKKEMNKIFEDFQQIHRHWVNKQLTISKVLHPKHINIMYNKLTCTSTLIDYNTYVDKILHISPCYDIIKRQKQLLPQFCEKLNSPENCTIYTPKNHKTNQIQFNPKEFQDFKDFNGVI